VIKELARLYPNISIRRSSKADTGGLNLKKMKAQILQYRRLM
jgi:hypothetical protein